MTEAEIMKALECCIEKRDLKQCNNYDCTLQYNTSTFAECKKMLVESALDLIKHKNKMIERSDKSRTEWREAALRKAKEAEKLQSEVANLKTASIIDAAKAEEKAIKKFANRVEELFPVDKKFTTISRFAIRQIAKEMGVEL